MKKKKASATASSSWKQFERRDKTRKNKKNTRNYINGKGEIGNLICVHRHIKSCSWSNMPDSDKINHYKYNNCSLAGCKEPQAISPCEEQKCWAAVAQKRRPLCESLISREWSRTLILCVCLSLLCALRLAERYTSELDCIGLTQLYVVISSRINWTAAELTQRLCRNHIWACYHIIIITLTYTVTLQYNNKLTNLRSAVIKFIWRQVCLAVIQLFKLITW